MNFGIKDLIDVLLVAFPLPDLQIDEVVVRNVRYI